MRWVAYVCIHVEGVIGSVVNKYKILHNTLPLDYLLNRDGEFTTIYKIVVVCCALVNNCHSLVPFD